MKFHSPLFKGLLIALALGMSACASHTGKSPTEQRQAIQGMKDQVLSELYKHKPSVRAQIASSAGYAVFDNANVNLILASFGGGYGMVKDMSSGKVTYMKMAEVGVGLGAGVKDFRAVFVFHNKEVLTRFVEEGWAFGAQADAAAKAGEQGAAASGEVTIDNITIYQLTKSGLALQATVKGTKYWKDGKLN